jgi:nitroimidazol reductase NimA-like FMN-containing flavoprotein (pyridoxamine 5'-phosphate oxidase superfamily)
MTADEAWAFVEQSHTGILTTLRRDGTPIALPVWFAALDRRIYVVTRGKKVRRVKRNPRCSFLVEAGERWAALQAVHLTCTGEVIEPSEELGRRIAEQMARKYSAFRTAPEVMPGATKDHYAKAQGATVELVPDERILSWDNNHLGLR